MVVSPDGSSRMRTALRGLMATAIVSVAIVVAGCDLLDPSSITESTTTTSITTTTTTTLPEPSWSQVEPEGETPSPRCYQAMVLDSTTGEIIMFGGVGAADALAETWSYDALTNEWAHLDVGNGEQPSAARQMPGAYDPAGLQIISFDGTTWGYDAAEAAWETLSPKGDRLVPARTGACMVMDQTSGKVILFGGTDMSVSFDETWSYDPAENRWTELQPEGEVPAGRSDAGMAYDATSGNIIMFGGVDSDFDCLGDTWSYDPTANVWTEIVTGGAPMARSGLALAYDRRSEQLIMFGGIDSQLTCYNDTWTLDPAAGTWTELDPLGDVPSARCRVSMVYVPGIDKLVVFGGAAVQTDAGGGFGSLIYLNDMWTFGVQGDGGVTATGDVTQ